MSARPRSVFRQTSEIVCDFCALPDPSWAYPTTDFAQPVEGEQRTQWNSHGGWAACEACHRLIERDDYRALVKRAAKRFARIHGGSVAEHTRALRVLFANFRESRTGEPPVPVTPGDPIDPTRKDEWGQMMRMSGQQVELHHYRPADKREDGKTLSKEAIETIAHQTAMWVGTRIMRQMELTGVAPQEVRLALDCALDDRPHEGAEGSQPVVFPLDGGNRLRAAAD